MDWIVPDRSDRPSSQPEYDTREFASDKTYSHTLSDGRPVVIETARVDDFLCRYFYFDRRGLETATLDELRALLSGVGLGWDDRNEDGRIYSAIAEKDDAAGRPIWEVQVLFPV